MRPAEIEAQLRQRPFVRFLLRMSDGTAYEVRHPEMVLVTRTIVAVAIYTAASDQPERAILCDPVHIIRLEPMDGRTKPRRRSRGR